MAEYILYTDKSENFTCEVDVKNASLKNSTARIILETQDINYVFNGEIKEGKCVVPIRKMKGMLDEGTKGTMKLEVIVEDVYFAPWSSPFVVDTNKQVTVKVVEQVEKKPTLTVKEVVMPKKAPSKTEIAAEDIKKILSENKITKATIGKQKKQMKVLVDKYFKDHEQLKEQKHSILTNVLTTLR